jgi:RNA polymerase sigma factor (sigma-70 family)
MVAMSQASPRADEPDLPTRSRWQRSAELFERWQDGDALAMDDLVRLMTPVLWHVVRGCGLDSALAEDVVQHTWLALVRQHDSITEPKAVAGWLLTTARREAWRVARQQNRADPADAADFDWRLPAQESAEDVAARRQDAAQLWQAVNQLTERCQQLLRVIAFDERPDYGRIARDLQIPVGSIGPTRLRCLAKLRTLLGEAA